MSPRERFGRWLRPELAVPTVPFNVAPELSQRVAPETLIFGRPLVVVTPRGVEIPILKGSPIPFGTVSVLLGQIEALPEHAPGSRRA